MKFLKSIKVSLSSSPGVSGDFKIFGGVADYGDFSGTGDGSLFTVRVDDINNNYEIRSGCNYTHSTRTLTRGTLIESNTGEAMNISSLATITDMSSIDTGKQDYVKVDTPTGFRWTTHPLNIRRVGSNFATDFDIASLIPPVTNTWYVDPVAGNNATAVVNNRNLPLLELDDALVKVDVDQVRIINLTSNFIGRVAKSWNNSQPSRSISVIVEGGYRYISAKTASSNPPVWTVNATYADVYQTPSTAANSSQVVDFSRYNQPSYINGYGTTVTLSNAPPIYEVLKKVASVQEVHDSTGGAMYNDGTNTYVKASDRRNLVGDQFMQPTLTANNNGRFPTTVPNLTIYCEGIDFVGGTPFSMSFASAITGCVFAHKNCSFQAAGSATNGLNVQSFATVIGQNSGAYNNWNDGFNYHSFEADGTTPATSPSCIEIGCVSVGNGTTGSAATSDNATTSHDYCNVIRLNGHYIDSDDIVMADVNSSNAWNIGCFIGRSIKGNLSVQSANSVKSWFDRSVALTDAPVAYNADGTSTLYHSNCGNVVNGGGTGKVTQYFGS